MKDDFVLCMSMSTQSCRCRSGRMPWRVCLTDVGVSDASALVGTKRPTSPSERPSVEHALCSLAHDTPASETSMTASAVLPREVALVCVLTDSPLVRTRWSDLYARGGYLSRIVDRIVAHAGAGADGSQPGTNVGLSPIILAVAKHWTSLTRKLT